MVLCCFSLEGYDFSDPSFSSIFSLSILCNFNLFFPILIFRNNLLYACGLCTVYYLLYAFYSLAISLGATLLSQCYTLSLYIFISFSLCLFLGLSLSLPISNSLFLCLSLQSLSLPSPKFLSFLALCFRMFSLYSLAFQPLILYSFLSSVILIPPLGALLCPLLYRLLIWKGIRKKETNGAKRDETFRGKEIRNRVDSKEKSVKIIRRDRNFDDEKRMKYN